MVDTGTGNLYIVGSFKRMFPDPDFKVTYYISTRCRMQCLALCSRHVELQHDTLNLVSEKSWFVALCRKGSQEVSLQGTDVFK